MWVIPYAPRMRVPAVEDVPPTVGEVGREAEVDECVLFHLIERDEAEEEVEQDDAGERKPLPEVDATHADRGR